MVLGRCVNCELMRSMEGAVSLFRKLVRDLEWCREAV